MHQLSAQANTIDVASSKSFVYAKRIINHFNLNKYINCIYGSKLDGSLSNKTDLVRHIIQCESLSPETTIMIGDRSFDVAAKNHGFPCLGVLWGYGSIAELEKASVDRTFSHPEQIYDYSFS